MSEPLEDQIYRRRDPRTLTSLPELLSCLSALESEEAEHSTSLSALLKAREPLLSSLKRLNTLVSPVDSLLTEANVLSSNVTNTAKTAERVGGRVRSLDEEMGRLREASDRVSQVMELKASLADLESSIESQDWEAATRHCARAMSLPPEVITGSFAEATVPTSKSHLPPVQTLQRARKNLLSIFQKNFEQASQSRDSTSTSRFFKLFPTIGWENEGLEAYATFVVDLVRVRTPPSAKSTSFRFWKNIALIVDQHRPIVEKYYGPGRMRNVATRLLSECDRVVKGIIGSWEEERYVKRKLLDIANNPPTAPSSYINRRTQAPSNFEEANIDPREVDKLLSELAVMIGRWSLFKKFLTESLNDVLEPDKQEVEVRIQQPATPIGGMDYIDCTESQRYFNRLITTYYTPFEVWYTQTSIGKAHILSNVDSTQSPSTSTIPDDVFYILKIVITRLFSTGDLKGVEATLEQLRNVVESDYIGVTRKKLEDVYRHSSGSGSVSRNEKLEKENRVVFITLLNDLDTSSLHMESLMRDLLGTQAISQYFPEDKEPLLNGYITTFASLSMKIRSALRLGIEQMFNQLMRPKLRSFIPDVYRDVSYILDEDTYAAAEHHDLVRKRFIKSWEGFVDGFKEPFTENNYRLFFGLVLDVVLRPWEKYVSTLKFTELGAIRFDRDLRSIMTFLASQTAFGDAREKFIRLQQMSTLLNLDNVCEILTSSAGTTNSLAVQEEDVDEFYNSSGITWKLSSSEARGIAGLKL
ncbi:hypothetical protein H0H93_012891 [Arthromyces matolae]|nr:hypothetical protein H0H93_012891 [Arthromyces matolae]